MSIWDELPRGSVTDNNLAPLILNPCADLDWIQVRSVAEGTIAITEVELGAALDPDKAIYVEGCQNILIGIHAVTLGTSAGLYIYPKFAMTRTGTYLRGAFHFFDDTTNLLVHSYITSSTVRLTSNQPQIVNLPNPGCRWMKMFAVSTTNVATSADIRIARGWGMPHIPTFNAAL